MPGKMIIAMSVAIPLTVLGVAQDDRVYKVGGDITMPEMLRQTTSSYTEEARKAGVQGIVILLAVIRKDGRVDRLKVVRGLGYGLDEQATQEIEKNWRFRPGTLDGNPVDVPATIEVQFNLLDPNLLVNYAQNGDPSAVRKLLDSGVKVDAKNEQSTTALMVAAQEGHTPTVQLLLDAGAKE
jgi:TonB family protein